MSKHVTDRFESATYADEEPVDLWLVEGGEADEVWIREPLWHRTRMVAAAYGLHLFPVLDGSTDPVFLNTSQCGGLMDELEFVRELVDDELVRQTTSAVHTLMARATRTGSDVGIEFP